jgi:fatty-acyl-CoA synthase
MTALSTLPAVLRRAAEGGRGITLLGGRNGEERVTYEEVRALSARVAGALRREGVREADPVLLVLPTGAEYLALFFGCIHAGAIPCTATPPTTLPADAFRRHLTQLVSLVGARLVVTDRDTEPIVAATLDRGTPLRLARDLMASHDALEEAAASETTIAFIQFTSGTTAAPRAVCLSHGSVTRNLEQIASAAQMNRDTMSVSWLPLFHDMGLVGSLLTSTFSCSELVLSRPAGFLRRPRSWLETITKYRGTHSPAPTFAYRYVLSRLTDGDLEGLDLSSWQTAWIGAEPVPAELLASFRERFARCGFGDTAFLPCYGLAEAALAVTFRPTGEPIRTLRVSRRAWTTHRVLSSSTSEDDALELVSCGRPLPGLRVSIRDAQDNERADGEEGEIVVTGPTLFSGYYEYDGAARTREAPPVESLRTGDLGFLCHGELYVTGRQKDLIIVRGRNHHPTEVECAADGVAGVRPGKVAAFGVDFGASDTESLCLVAETDRRVAIATEALVIELRRRVFDQTGLTLDHVTLVAPGSIPHTTSGKIQRRRARELFLAMHAGARAPAPQCTGGAAVHP